jgi:hypothetical protein
MDDGRPPDWQGDTPPFWVEKALRMVGKHVLVGKTYVRGEDVVEQVQFHGVIEQASERNGFALRRADTGEIEWLPPDMRAFERAEPGEYRLRSTGEVVVDPDILSTWVVEREGDRRLSLVQGDGD